MTITGERLRSLREQRGQSQEEIAKLIGVGRTTYLKYESGENKPTRKLKELSALFNVTSDYIMGLSDNPHGTPFGGQQEGDFLRFAHQQESTSERVKKALQEYRAILSNHDGHVATRQMRAFYKEHLDDDEFFEALTKQTPMDGGLSRRERNMLAHYRIADEDTQQKIYERTKELVTLFMLSDNNKGE